MLVKGPWCRIYASVNLVVIGSGNGINCYTHADWWLYILFPYEKYRFNLNGIRTSVLDSLWPSDAVCLLYSTFHRTNEWLTNSSVEFDFNEAIVAGTVHFQHFNSYEGRPDMVYGKLIPMLAEIRCPRSICVSTVVFLRRLLYHYSYKHKSLDLETLEDIIISCSMAYWNNPRKKQCQCTFDISRYLFPQRTRQTRPIARP